MSIERMAEICLVVGACLAASAAAAHDLATATANVARACMAGSNPAEMGVSEAALQAYCRCAGEEAGRQIPLAELSGPATPKFDALLPVIAKNGAHHLSGRSKE